MTEQGIELRFWSDRRVEPQAYDVAPPGPGQVLVRNARTQVSAGTEMNFFRHNPVDGPLTSSVLGYMGVGRVAAVGDGVTGYALGDRVITSSTHGSHWLVSPNDPASSPMPNEPAYHSGLSRLVRAPSCSRRRSVQAR